MNPVFWFLVIVVAVILWFIISFVFIPLGRVVSKKWDKIIEILNTEDEIFKNDEKGEEKNE